MDELEIRNLLIKEDREWFMDSTPTNFKKLLKFDDWTPTKEEVAANEDFLVSFIAKYDESKFSFRKTRRL